MDPPAQPGSSSSSALLHEAHVQVTTHETTGVTVAVDARRTKHDLEHTRLIFKYYRISLYWILPLAFIMRGVCFVIALLTTGALLMAEIMMLTAWVEPVILVLVVFRNRLGLFSAKYICLGNLVANVLYLCKWYIDGRRYSWLGSSRMWWAAWTVLAFYTVLDMAMLFCLINMIKAKSTFCHIINVIRRAVDDRKNQKI
jgi:hypothetical protein